MKQIVYIFFIFIIVGCSDKSSPNDVKFNSNNMALVIGGKYLMGTVNDYFKDKPVSGVYVSSFYMDTSEVTNIAYKQYLELSKDKIRRPKYLDDKILGSDNLPVVDVTYDEALSYCKFHNKDLPTEAQWEYGARGGFEMMEFPWGKEESPSRMNFRGSGTIWSLNVKSYTPNKYGLYDMSGNVREWVKDTYRKDYYTHRCTKSKKKGSMFELKHKDCRINPVNLEKGELKSNRGGSWNYTNGYPNTVYFRTFDYKSKSYNDLGFRCSKEILKQNPLNEKVQEYKKILAEKLNIDLSKMDISADELTNQFSSQLEGLPNLGDIEKNLPTDASGLLDKAKGAIK